MEAPDEHPFAVIIRSLTRTLEVELRRSFLRLTTTLIALLAGAMVLITAAMTAVVVGIVHLCRGMVTLTELMIGPSWGAEMATGAFLLLIPLLVAALMLRRSKSPGKDAE